MQSSSLDLLGIFSSTEQCQTQLYEDDLNSQSDLKNEEDLKNETDLKNEDNLKIEDDPQNGDM